MATPEDVFVDEVFVPYILPWLIVKLYMATH